MNEKDKYYVITTSEDGDINIEEMDKHKLEKRLNDKDDGPDQEWLEKIEEHEDLMYWGGVGMIIKGRIIRPKSKTIVTEFEIE